jgi:hypothetical protein
MRGSAQGARHHLRSAVHHLLSSVKPRRSSKAGTWHDVTTEARNIAIPNLGESGCCRGHSPNRHIERARLNNGLARFVLSFTSTCVGAQDSLGIRNGVGRFTLDTRNGWVHFAGIGPVHCHPTCKLASGTCLSLDPSLDCRGARVAAARNSNRSSRFANPRRSPVCASSRKARQGPSPSSRACHIRSM